MHNSYSSLGVRLVLAGEPLFIMFVLISIREPVSEGAILFLSDMQSLEHRRYYSSLVLLYKCMNSNCPQ